MCTFQDKHSDIPREQLRIKARCVHPSGNFKAFRKEHIET